MNEAIAVLVFVLILFVAEAIEIWAWREKGAK